MPFSKLSHALCVLGPVAAQVLVNTPLGPLIGVDNSDYSVFRGIPYSEVPERFEPPVAKLAWGPSVTVDATKFGAPCPAVNRGPEVGANEDCLFLNVWRPTGADKLPVLVFIHGGGFYEDSAVDVHYWLDGLMNKRVNPVVGVTFNYRLGAFGFYASGASVGNYGLMDQQVALKWVRDNIASFGGDPNRVTISGQSAGAMSSLIHMVAPDSAGLFHRVFAASPVGLHYHTPSEAADVSSATANSVGCWRLTDGWTLNCLKQASVESIRKAMLLPEYIFHIFGDCPNCVNWLPWLPTVGDTLLPASPIDAFAQGMQMKVPTVISTVRNETDAWIPGIINIVPLTALDTVFFGNYAHNVTTFYDASPDTAQMDNVGRFGVALTDTLFTCYNRHLAGQLSKEAPTYLSTFIHAPGNHTDVGNKSPMCHDDGTCHAGDLPFMLPYTAEMQSLMNMSYAPGEEALAQLYSDALLAFVHGDSSVFVEYDAAADRGIGWGDDGPYPLAQYHKGHCDFMEALGYAVSPWGTVIPTVSEAVV